MPVNPYEDFVQNISPIDNIAAQYKANQSNLRTLRSGQKAITDARNLTKQYNSAATGIKLGNSRSVGGNTYNSPYSPTGGGGGGNFDRFLHAIKMQESGGRYGVRGIPTKGSRALGAYQIMGFNLPSWSKKVLGRRVSEREFMSSPKIQDQIAAGVLRGYYNKWGAGGAAAAWYGGPGAGAKYARGVRNKGKQYGGPSIANYVKQVLSRM